MRVDGTSAAFQAPHGFVAMSQNMELANERMKPEVVVFDLGGVLCEFSTKRRLDALSSASGLPPHEVALRLDDCRLIELADRGQLTRRQSTSER